MGWTIATLAGLGCSRLGANFKEPEVRLDRAVVRGIGLAGGNLDLIVRVANPEQLHPAWHQLQVGIDVEGSHLGDITYDDDFAVIRERPNHPHLALEVWLVRRR